MQKYSVDHLTPAYAITLGNLDRFPVPSAYTLAAMKINFDTCKSQRATSEQVFPQLVQGMSTQNQEKELFA